MRRAQLLSLISGGGGGGAATAGRQVTGGGGSSAVGAGQGRASPLRASSPAVMEANLPPLISCPSFYYLIPQAGISLARRPKVRRSGKRGSPSTRRSRPERRSGPSYTGGASVTGGSASSMACVSSELIARCS